MKARRSGRNGLTVAELGLGYVLLFPSAAEMAAQTSDRSPTSATQITVTAERTKGDCGYSEPLHRRRAGAVAIRRERSLT